MVSRTYPSLDIAALSPARKWTEMTGHATIASSWKLHGLFHRNYSIEPATYIPSNYKLRTRIPFGNPRHGNCVEASPGSYRAPKAIVLYWRELPSPLEI